MGAAGIVEVCVSIKSLDTKIVPNTINLIVADEEAEGWVSDESCPLEQQTVLSTNSGFGGINTAIVLCDKNA